MKIRLKQLSGFASIASCLCVLFGCQSELEKTDQHGIPGEAKGPYPPSKVLRSITWHWETYANAAPGSDLWPVTWGADDNIYAAWGDGGGFGGTDSQGRVSLGFARIEGGPENFRGFNVNGGEKPEHAAMFPKKGKASGILSVGGILYANINLQDGTWPDVHHQLAWSTNGGADWTLASWKFPKGLGQFQPAKFLNFGKDYSGVPQHLAGYVYLYGFKQAATREEIKEVCLVRAPQNKILEQAAYEFFQGCDNQKQPQWKADFATAQSIFTDANGTAPPTVVYDAPLHRYLATSFHIGPGQLGIFDAPEPWGPWTTVAYYENWGGMGTAGEGLSCEFPGKWMSSDGLTLWSIFGVYGEGGKQGLKAHDRFNLMKVTLTRAP